MNFRLPCTATLIGQYIWVLGGHKQEGRVSVLDTVACRWGEVHVKLGNNEFSPFHEAVLFKDTILVYGVRVKGQLAEVSREVYALDVVTNELELLAATNTNHRPPWNISTALQLYPQAASLIFVSGSLLGADLHLFDLNTSIWKVLETKGRAPAVHPLATLGSCLVGSKLVVHDLRSLNGWGSVISCIDLTGSNKLVWSQLPGCAHQVNRKGPALSYVGKGRIILYGGFTENVFEEHLTIVEDAKSDVPTMHQVRKKTRNSGTDYIYTGDSPGLRHRPRVVVMHEKLVILGGSVDDGSTVHFLTPVLDGK